MEINPESESESELVNNSLLSDLLGNECIQTHQEFLKNKLRAQIHTKQQKRSSHFAQANKKVKNDEWKEKQEIIEKQKQEDLLILNEKKAERKRKKRQRQKENKKVKDDKN